MNQKLITDILECIRRETGLVLARESDRARIERYLERGGEVPQPNKPLPTELINLVTTNETYFERERHHFDYLMNEILPELNVYQCGTFKMHSLDDAKGIAQHIIDEKIGINKNEDIALAEDILKGL